MREERKGERRVGFCEQRGLRVSISTSVSRAVGQSSA